MLLANFLNYMSFYLPVIYSAYSWSPSRVLIVIININVTPAYESHNRITND